MKSRKRNIFKRYSKKGGSQKKNIKIYFKLIKLVYVDFTETEQDEANLEQSEFESMNTKVLDNYLKRSIDSLKDLFSKKKTYDDEVIKFLNSIIFFKIEKILNDTYNFQIDIELSDYEQRLEYLLDILCDSFGSNLLIYTDSYNDNTNLAMGAHKIIIT